MIKTIHKHALLFADVTVQMRHGASILSVGMQDDDIVLWESHDEDADGWTDRRFIAVNTGGRFDGSAAVHLGTVTSVNGIVWHVFEAAVFVKENGGRS